MTFEEMVAEVISLTRRPDLEAKIESAVKAATLKAHQSDYFFNDLTEVAIEFDQPRFIQNFRPRDVLPRYRHAKYIRIWRGGASSDARAFEFLEHIHVENAIDGYGYNKLNVFYFAGELLQMRVRQPVEHVLFGAYQHPNITTENFNSWIAEDYPYTIVYEAARSIFLSTSFQEQAAQMRTLVQEEYGILKLSNVDTPPT
jgi:hypothetical protein